MEGVKHTFESAILGRSAHADVYCDSSEPRFLFVLFGGSGIDRDEYERRAGTLAPLFNGVLSHCSDIRFAFMYATAPYDVPFRRFPRDPSLASDWNRHVSDELLGKWRSLPLFVCGFSGGALLALSGTQNLSHCFGAAAMGLDGLPASFALPQAWRTRLQIYSGADDRVCNHPRNRGVVESLAATGQADCFLAPRARHRLADYATPSCLGRIIRYAAGAAPT